MYAPFLRRGFLKMVPKKCNGLKIQHRPKF